MTHTRPIIHLYAMCLNERRMIPFFFKHYTDLVDRFFIYDNGSTDGSIEMLKADERVTVRHFDTEPPSFVETARRLLNRVWQRSRGEADWVIIVEMDEHLHHRDLRGYLAFAKSAGTTIMRCVGYDMVCSAFPAGPAPLFEQVTRGARQVALDKIGIIDPHAIVETNFEHGRHKARPTGRVAFEPFPQVKLLHYKNLGAEYVAERNATLVVGLGEEDLKKGWGRHYLAKIGEIEHGLQRFAQLSRRVPGLGQEILLDPTMDQEQALIRSSGYFDADYYLKTSPDIVKAGLDPLSHFCGFGWQENRNPNPLFDMGWYRETYKDNIPTNVNALLEYILVGRNANRMTSIGFDPQLYRLHRKLQIGVDELGHALRSWSMKPWWPGALSPDSVRNWRESLSRPRLRRR